MSIPDRQLLYKGYEAHLSVSKLNLAIERFSLLGFRERTGVFPLLSPYADVAGVESEVPVPVVDDPPFLAFLAALAARRFCFELDDMTYVWCDKSEKERDDGGESRDEGPNLLWNRCNCPDLKNY